MPTWAWVSIGVVAGIAIGGIVVAWLFARGIQEAFGRMFW